MTTRVMIVAILQALRLNKILARIYYRYIHGFASAGQELPDVVHRCMQRATEQGIAQDSDYCEFGIFKGHTFLHAQMSAQKLGLEQMRFFGFDSFEGLPEPHGIDITAQEHFYKGQYTCSIESVRKELGKRGVVWDRTFLIKGFFCDTLNEHAMAEHGISKVAVALVDGDLYESTVDCLTFLRKLLIDQSILIMDDWNGFDGANDRGQRRAMAEFLVAEPRWHAEPWFTYGSYGQVFIMHKTKGSDNAYDN